MKRKFVLISLGLGCALAVGAQTMDFDKLPPAVQQSITERKGPDRIKSIEFEARNGIAGYVVEFGRRGFNPKLVIAPDGTVIEYHRLHVPIPKDENGLNWDLPETAAKRVSEKEIPVAVRDRISREAKGRPVIRIQSKPHGDQKVFAVEFKQRGRNERVYILENGSLLAHQSPELDSAITGVGAPPVVQTGSGLMHLQLEELPLEVQNTIKAHGGTANLVDVARVPKNGGYAFRARFRANGGPATTLEIADDGTVTER